MLVNFVVLSIITSFALCSPELTLIQKRRCEQFINIFDNNSKKLNYPFVQNFDDGRGITSGRSRFTTNSGDAFQVVLRYTLVKGPNSLEKYLPILRRLSQSKSEDVSELIGYEEAWKISTEDPQFQIVQDEIDELLYYKPAMEWAEKIKVKTPLGKCIFYDTILQHKNGDDPDSFGTILAKTQKEVGPVVVADAAEATWLRAFLTTRLAVLLDPHNKKIKNEWNDSAERVVILLRLIKVENFTLEGPIEIDSMNFHETIS